MSKKKKGKTKKGLSEGKAIAVAVILFAGGLIALIYILQFIIGYFFPNL